MRERGRLIAANTAAILKILAQDDVKFAIEVNSLGSLHLA
jgi:hypothetical protein